MAKRGRPSKYKPEYAKTAARLSKLGYTDMQLCEVFGCSVPTFYRWQAHFPKFRKSIKLGKDEPDERVARALYQRAVGYSHDDVHISNFQGEVTVTPIVKHYPPDTAAAFIWLKNRRPKEWRDKHEFEHSATSELTEALKAARERASTETEDSA